MHRCARQRGAPTRRRPARQTSADGVEAAHGAGWRGADDGKLGRRVRAPPSELHNCEPDAVDHRLRAAPRAGVPGRGATRRRRRAARRRARAAAVAPARVLEVRAGAGAPRRGITYEHERALGNPKPYREIERVVRAQRVPFDRADPESAVRFVVVVRRYTLGEPLLALGDEVQSVFFDRRATLKQRWAPIARPQLDQPFADRLEHSLDSRLVGWPQDTSRVQIRAEQFTCAEEAVRAEDPRVVDQHRRAPDAGMTKGGLGATDFGTRRRWGVFAARTATPHLDWCGRRTGDAVRGPAARAQRDTPVPAQPRRPVAALPRLARSAHDLSRVSAAPPWSLAVPPDHRHIRFGVAPPPRRDLHNN